MIHTTYEGVGESITVQEYSTAHIDRRSGELYFQTTTTPLYINGLHTDEILANFKKIIRDLRKEFKSNYEAACSHSQKIYTKTTDEYVLKDFVARFLRREAYLMMRRNCVPRGSKIGALRFQVFIEIYNKATVALAMSGPVQLARAGNWIPQIKEEQLALPFAEIRGASYELAFLS